MSYMAEYTYVTHKYTYMSHVMHKYSYMTHAVCVIYTFYHKKSNFKEYSRMNYLAQKMQPHIHFQTEMVK